MSVLPVSCSDLVRSGSSYGARSAAGVGFWIWAQPGAVVQLIHCVHVIDGQFEIEDVEVAGNVLGFGGPEDYCITQLQVPPKQYLCRCFAIFGGDRGQGRIVHQPAKNQWGVGLGDNVVLCI